VVSGGFIEVSNPDLALVLYRIGIFRAGSVHSQIVKHFELAIYLYADSDNSGIEFSHHNSPISSGVKYTNLCEELKSRQLGYSSFSVINKILPYTKYRYGMIGVPATALMPSNTTPPSIKTSTVIYPSIPLMTSSNRLPLRGIRN